MNRARTYSVKEIFYTLQGEGAQTGRASVFLRFSGCNLWTGREEDRANSICQFCDTDFVGTDGLNGGKYNAAELVQKVSEVWSQNVLQDSRRYVVCTGGEPGLQLSEELVEALHQAGFCVAVETNGTVALPAGIDWICVSPKADAALVTTRGSELKLVYPQEKAHPSRFEQLDFEHFFLQPCDNAQQNQNIEAAIRYCQQHPQWRLSLQTHKWLGIP